jgi:hypothetical protein
MRKTPLILASLFAFSTAALVGCDVEKTQEGNVTAPKYEVTKKQDGDVTVPKYDVTAPSVDVNTKQAEVTVPKVVTEKETIAVPNVDIKTGQEKKAEEKVAQQKP